MEAPAVKTQPPADADPTEPHLPEKQADPVHIATIWAWKAGSGSVQWVHDCQESQIRFYCLRKQLKFMRTIVKYLILLSAVVETPSYCIADRSQCIVTPGTLVLPGLPVNIFMSLLWMYLIYDLWLRYRSLGEAHTFHGWHAVGTTLVIVAFLDCFIAIFNTSGLLFWTTFRVSRFFRPVIFLAFTKSLRDSAGRVIRSIPYFIDMLAGLAICLIIFAWTGLVIFAGTPEGAERFKDGSSAISNLWILFEGGAGNPDVWLPAFRQHYFFFFFFLAYCLLTVYILNSMLLSSIYDFYKEQLKEDVCAFFERRQAALEQAFDLLKDGDTGQVSIGRWKEFYTCIHDHGFGYRFPLQEPPHEDFNQEKATHFFRALDKDHSGTIDLDEFQCLIDAMFHENSYIPKTPPPKMLSSDWRKPLHWLFTKGVPFSIGDHKGSLTWDHFVDFVIAIDVAIVLGQTLSMSDQSSRLVASSTPDHVWYWALLMFSIFYATAVSMKIVVFGFERFWNMKPVQHRFDFFNVYPLLAVELLCLFFSFGGHIHPGMLRAILILHIVRVFRIIQYVPALNYLGRFLVKLAPTYYRMGMLLVLLFYMYTVVAIQVFGGLLTPRNPALAGSDYASSNYWAFHFNDFPTGMVTMFNFMMLNNWWVFSAALVRATNRWAVIFSISFFVIVNLIVLNILIALIIECAGSMKETDEQKGDEDTSYEAVLRRVLLHDDLHVGDHVAHSNSSLSTTLPSGLNQPALYGATDTGTEARTSDVDATSSSV